MIVSMIAHLLGAKLQFCDAASAQATDWRRTRPVHRWLFAASALPLVILALLLWRVGQGWMGWDQFASACRDLAPVCALYSLTLIGSGLILRRRWLSYKAERRRSKEFGTFATPLDF